MSGFAGIVNFDQRPVNSALIQRMVDGLAYRGPDAQNVWTDDYVGLGHTLFATTAEADHEHQPFVLGSLTAVGDVRLDARDELLRLLEHKGAPVEAYMPDINLIAYAYQLAGEDCLEWLQGDFAFAIWDGERDQLLCARDQLGLRAFYYAHVGETFIFSNEIGAIRKHPLVRDQLSDTAVGDFLMFSKHTRFDKTLTIYDDIYRLAPAHLSVVRAGGVRLRQYWQLPTDHKPLVYRKEQDYVDHFWSIFSRAVEDRTRSSQMVSALSGGMDSTSVAAIAQQILTQRNQQLVTHTGVYNSRIEDFERMYSDLVAQKLGVRHELFDCDGYAALDPLYPTPEPTDYFYWPMGIEWRRLVARLGRVELMGRGGDELFTPELVDNVFPFAPLNTLRGYISAWRYFGERPPVRLKKTLRNFLRHRVPPLSFQVPFNFPTWLNEDFVQRANLRERWAAVAAWTVERRHPFHPRGYEFLNSPDWLASAEYAFDAKFAPVDTAMPFLDLRLINFVFSIPAFPWTYQKFMLRRALKDHLPPEVLARPKTPLGDISQAYLQDAQTEWMDRWRAVPGLGNYVERDQIPAIHGELNSSQLYINARPLLLNTWVLMHNERQPVPRTDSLLLA